MSVGYTLCRNEPIDQFRYQHAGAERAMLAESWSIHGRDDVLDQLWWLLTQGHRTEWETLRALVLSGDQQVQRMRSQLSKSYQTSAEAREQLLQIRRMKRNERDLHQLNFSAWDLTRVIMLARSALAAGYLEEQLAEDIALQAAGYVQQEYANWEQYSTAFLTDRWFWKSDRSAEGALSEAHDRHREQVLGSADGPYQQVNFTRRGIPSRLLILSTDPVGWAMRAAHLPGDLNRDWHRELLMRARAGTERHPDAGGHSS